MSLLESIESCIKASLPEPMPTTVSRGAYGAVWRPEHPVPGMLAAWPLIAAYVDNPKISIEVQYLGTMSAWIIGDPVPTEEGLDVVYGFSIGRSHELTLKQDRKLIPYPSEFMRDLFMGRAASFGQYQFRMTTPFKMPQFTQYDSKVRITLPTITISRPVGGRLVQKITRWRMSASLVAIDADSTGADVRLLGLPGKVVAPRLVWK